MCERSQKVLVDRYINWVTVEERLSKYKSIGAYFDIKFLKECSTKPPFYCHYLAWRLGTWQGEDLFEKFDDLLARILHECKTERGFLHLNPV
ncbi:hypothetical protein UR09_04920, partial [Candidatus Nitromaritima sp. SCGC AAA799-A02]